MRLTLTVALAVFAASCGADPAPPRVEAGSRLAELTLQADEAPEGMELDEDASGAAGSLREVLPPQAATPQLTPLGKAVRRAFAAAYSARYVAGEDGGPASVGSSVVRFSAEAPAEAFLQHLRDVQLLPVPGRTSESAATIAAPGLGDEGYAWHRETSGGETAGCSWRVDAQVFTLTLAGPLGTASVAEAIALAERVDARLG